MDKKLSKFSNRNLIKILIKLNKWKISTFKTYLHTQDSSKGGITTKFFERFSIAHPDYPENEFLIFENHPAFVKDTPNLKAHFFKGDQLDSNKINTACNQILRALEQWLVLQEVINDSALYGELLTKVYNRMAPNSPYFYKQSNKSITKIQREYKFGIIPHYHLFQIKSHQLYHADAKWENKNLKTQDLSNHLDHHFVSYKLRLYSQYLSERKIITKSDDLQLSNEVIIYAAKYPNNPQFRMYLNLIKLFKTNDLALLQPIQLDFETNYNVFDRKEKSIYLRILINYVIRLTSTGRYEYVNLQFYLLKLLIKLDLLIFNNRVTDASFNNVIDSACFLREFKFARQFKNKYAPYLHQNVKEDLTNFTEGLILFHEKKYDEAIKSLISVLFRSLSFKLRGRSLLLRCQYEQLSRNVTLYPNFLASINYFHQIISKNTTLSNERKAHYLKFTQALRALAKATINNATTTKLIIREKLVAEYNKKEVKMIAKRWFLQKVKELDKRTE